MLSMGLLPAARASRRCRTDSEKPGGVLTRCSMTSRILGMKHLLHTLPVPMAVELPAGQHVGAPDPAVVLRFRDRMALVALASGDIGHVGAAIVEGRVALEGGMRDLMAAATGLLTREPARDQHHG